MDNCTHINILGDTGFELIANKPEYQPVSKLPGAKSGALGAQTGALDAIAKQIQSLSDEDRAALIRLMKGE